MTTYAHTRIRTINEKMEILVDNIYQIIRALKMNIDIYISGK